MKKHILVGTSLLLTFGTAVAGTLMYGQGSNEVLGAATVTNAQQEPSAMTIQMWKATARSSEYMAPKAPI